MAIAYLRPRYGYAALSEDEIGQVIVDVKDLLEWLKTIELTESDFVRSALIEGLTFFLLKIEKVGFYGWRETFTSLREVIAAYMALERGAPDEGVSPPYEAIVKKSGVLIKGIYDKIKLGKEVQELADWALRGYGALSVIGQASHPIAGLLTHSS